MQVFRRRLTQQQAVDFAQVLPAVLGALFVADWHIAETAAPGTRADWTHEAQALRPHHSLTLDKCIAATAYALRKSVLRADLKAVLAKLPPSAAEFWDVPGMDTASLGPSTV